MMKMIMMVKAHLAKATISSTLSGRALPAVSGSHNPDKESDVRAKTTRTILRTMMMVILRTMTMMTLEKLTR